MKLNVQRIIYFFLAIVVLAMMPGCISQKKLDAFRQKHADSTVFEYVYGNRTYLAAVRVNFYLTEETPGSALADKILKDPGSVDLNDYMEPAIRVEILPPVFLKMQHQEKIRLLIDKKNITASGGLRWENGADLTVVDEVKPMIFYIDKENASTQETLKLNLEWINERGEKLKADVLSFRRVFNLILPKTEKGIPEKCPEVRFTIHFSSKTEDQVTNVQMRNDTTGVFLIDPDGQVKVNICQDLLPISYSFLIEAFNYQTKEIRIKFEENKPDIFIELEENPQGNLVEDHDGDGLVGEEDRCPEIAGPASNGGCPVDTDGDGIIDVEDRCPDQPGLIQNNGCPPPPEINENKGLNETENTRPLQELQEEIYWNTIESSTVPQDFEDYLNQFPDGKYVQQAQEKLKDSYTKIAKGLMSILIPDTMELNVPEIITVMISGDTSLAARERVIDEFLDQQDLAPKDIPEVRDELIKITEIMRAELRDPSPPNNRNFFIDPPGEREQKVDLYGKDPTIWNWTVTPLQKGNHRLNVVVSIIFDQNGKEVPKVEEQLFQILIIVQPTFLQKNLWWMLTTLVLMGALLWLFLFRKKKKQQEKIQLNLPYQKIMGLIGEGELKEALQSLEGSLQGVSDKYYQQVVLFKSRHAENEENIQLGVIDTKDATLEQTRITKGVLTLMSKLKEEFNITG